MSDSLEKTAAKPEFIHSTETASEVPREPSATEQKSATAEPTKSAKIATWKQVDNDLKNALDSWELLTEKMANKPSPDQEQLREVKRLLSELKNKIQEFN